MIRGRCITTEEKGVFHDCIGGQHFTGGKKDYDIVGKAKSKSWDLRDFR